jgi:hypothetical protein
VFSRARFIMMHTTIQPLNKEYGVDENGCSIFSEKKKTNPSPWLIIGFTVPLKNENKFN